jgi:hypothetical protein
VCARVANVDGDRDAVINVRRGFTTPPPRFILDVVLDEEGVVVNREPLKGGQGLIAFVLG